LVPLQEELHLSDLSLSPLCDGVITTDVTHTVVAVARGNCTFSEKALTVQDAGGAAVLIISRTALVRFMPLARVIICNMQRLRKNVFRISACSYVMPLPLYMSQDKT